MNEDQLQQKKTLTLLTLLIAARFCDAYQTDRVRKLAVFIEGLRGPEKDCLFGRKNGEMKFFFKIF